MRATPTLAEIDARDPGDAIEARVEGSNLAEVVVQHHRRMERVAYAHAGRAEADPRMVARVSISEQTMRVLIDGRGAFRWPVSRTTGGYVTPTGAFRPTRMHRMS